mmetsp:Transcript_6682/g.19101  ORF Transcript_6682/g.19101 Transcript_6682/m.19101 type:complete len:201 (+) Transcript_6682:1136-1738(+)
MVTEAQIQNNAIEMVPSRLKGCRKGILRASPPRMNLWIAPSTAKITIVGHVVRLEKDWSASADVVCLVGPETRGSVLSSKAPGSPSRPRIVYSVAPSMLIQLPKRCSRRESRASSKVLNSRCCGKKPVPFPFATLLRCSAALTAGLWSKTVPQGSRRISSVTRSGMVPATICATAAPRLWPTRVKRSSPSDFATFTASKV